MTKYRIFGHSYLQLSQGQYNRTSYITQMYSSYELIIFFLDELVLHALDPFEGESEINELDIEALFVQEQEILGFEISMSNFLFMTVIE